MKKLLLCVALCSALFLVGCNNNNNQNKVNNNTNNNSSNNNSNTSVVDPVEEIPNDPIVQYESPDFSEKAGFKIDLGSSLEGVTYDSVFLMNNSTAQLDLVFPDKSIGTLLIDSRGSSHLYDIDDTLYVGETTVSVKVGADGITVYEWMKDNYAYVYSTTSDLKNSQTLTNLVNDISINVTNE